MTLQKNSLEAWMSLYDAATRFKQTACWNWMCDDNIFGIQNPVTKEIGYACVLGKAGEIYALNVFLGADGFSVCMKMLREKVDEYSYYNIMYEQHCLQAAFLNRQELSDEDIKIIKTLDLRFRGANAWPQFRNYSPGYYPWYLAQAEIEYLTVALEQTIEVSLRCRNNPDILISPERSIYLTRMANIEGDKIVWKDDYRKPPLEEIKVVPGMATEDIRIHRIRKNNFKRQGIWEADVFFYPNSVREKKDRPYFPRLFFIMDEATQMVLTTNLFPPDNYMIGIRNTFIDFIEKNKVIPTEVRAKNQIIVDLLKPVGELLQFNLVAKKRLPGAELFQKSIYEDMHD
jgi:hypothetical protein